MRHPAAQGRTDANQSEIVAAYESLYCLVQDTHAVGGGFGDLVVRIPTKRGAVVNIVEVKTLDGTLRPSQERFAQEWGSAVVVVACAQDVFSHVEMVRAR